jgi:hypothetical protein
VFINVWNFSPDSTYPPRWCLAIGNDFVGCEREGDVNDKYLGSIQAISHNFQGEAISP